MTAERLRHNALVYESDTEYVERSARILRAGLEAGEATVLAAPRDRLAAVREALGADAARVELVDAGSVYTRPVRAIHTYVATLRRLLANAPAARLIAEVQFGPTPAEWDEWTAYEALVNRVFAAFPAWIVCTYDAGRLPDRVLEAAWRAHPEVLSGDWQRSARFEDPAALARAVTPAAAPLPGLDDVDFGTSAETLREALARALAAARVPDGKALGMLLAASEVAANAWRHSGGPTAVRAGRADGRFVCEIADGGAGFDDPLAGFIAAAPGERASGLSVARRLTWRLEHYRSPTGFTVRLWL